MPHFTIGVLALQGAYDVHAAALSALGATPKLIRHGSELAEIDGLILPGGESSTMLRQLDRDAFYEPLREYTRIHPTFGTCAGCILLASAVSHPEQRSFGVLDVSVERNAYGRQNDSAILLADAAGIDGGPLEMVFIRAPRITRTGPEVEVLAKRDADPVLVRQGHLLAATFHPELSTDLRVHQLFLNLVAEYPSKS